MRHIILLLVVVALQCSCIGQEKEWTAEDWKEHLFYMDLREQSTPGVVSGFHNTGALPVGRHVAYEIEFEGDGKETEMPQHMVMSVTVSGEEVKSGVTYKVVDITMDMEMQVSGQAMTMVFEAKEWVDEKGVPLKMVGKATGKIQGMEMPISLTAERTGEEVYEGHDCWVFTMTETVDMPGFLPSTEMKVIQYMDKKTYAVVRMITQAMGTETDTGYIKPALSEEVVWELGGKETITTKMGTYECQIIYLKENGETVGTIWATKDIETPLKQVYSWEQEGSEYTVVMTLLEYTSGG